MKGNLLIKQSTFAECREGVQKYLGVCSPSHHPSWFMQLEIYKTACFIILVNKNVQETKIFVQ